MLILGAWAEDYQPQAKSAEPGTENLMRQYSTLR